MKKNKIILFIAFLLVSCGSQETNPTTSSNENTTNTTTFVENYKVVLPQIQGVELALSNENPSEGEQVRLFVKNILKESLRIDEVSVNGVALEGYNTSIEDCKAYDFYMPSTCDAVVNIDVVDVYPVLVANQLKSILSLSGIGEGLFKEGEKVTFTPTTFRGYWYNNVSLVNNDVELNDNKDGSFSFIMPNHAVTVSAEFGKNVYSVSYENRSNLYTVSFKNESVFTFGEKVTFSITPVNPDISITKVVVDNNELTLENEKYSFVMPAYPVSLDIEYSMVTKTFIIENSSHYNATLKLEDGTLVNNDNVISNQKVIIDVLDNGNEINHDYVIDEVKVYQGNSSNNLNVELNSVNKVGNQYTFVTTAYKYYKIVILEKLEVPVFEASFKGITLSNSSSSHTLEFKGETKIVRSSTNGTIISNNPNYVYTISSWGTDYRYIGYLSPSEEYLIEFNEGYSYNGTFYRTGASSYNYSLSFFIKDNLYPEELDVYSIISCDEPTYPSSYYLELIAFMKKDGTFIYCLFDYETLTPYFDVEVKLIEGTNGKTANDIISIYSSDGDLIETLKLSSTVKGNQHRATKA